jgi:hypothetical protein
MIQESWEKAQRTPWHSPPSKSQQRFSHWQSKIERKTTTATAASLAFMDRNEHGEENSKEKAIMLWRWW